MAVLALTWSWVAQPFVKRAADNIIAKKNWFIFSLKAEVEIGPGPWGENNLSY